jgi:dihydroneopterin aldolase
MNNAALADNVRGWVHYDNLASSLQKQVLNARNERDRFENNVHQLLKEQQMINAVIQISGAQLQLQEDKVTSGLTIKVLQESIQSFFRGHPECPNPDKLTNELLNHIKQQRSIHTNLRLKKLKAAPTQG